MNALGRFQLLLLALAVSAAAVVVLATRHGVGLSPDSATYIAGARQLARGHGLTTPQGGEAITHFPPLFPAILAASHVAHIDAIPAARVLNLSLWVITIFLVGSIAHRSSGNSAAAGLISAALVATSVDLLNVHAWAWSEPLLICCGFSGLWLLQKYLWSPQRKLLIAAAVLIAAAFLARYAGAAIVLTGVLGLLLHGRAFHRKVWNAVLFLAITLAPTAGWIVRNKLVSANATNREAVYHPVSLKQLSQAVATIAGWIVPNVPTRRGVLTTAERAGVPLVLVLMVLIVGIGFLAMKHARAVADGDTRDEANRPRAPWLFGLFLPVYVAFLLASLCFFDAQIPLDDRMLSPLLAATICFVVPAAAVASSPPAARQSIFRPAVALGCSCLIGWFLYRDAVWVRDTRRAGLGYASPEWKRSGVMAAIRALPPDAFIYTNSPGGVLLLADRVCADVPEKTDRNSTLPRKDYQGRIIYMRQRLEGGAYLAYFRSVRSRHNLPSEIELREALAPVEETVASDGVVYRIMGATTKP